MGRQHRGRPQGVATLCAGVVAVLLAACGGPDAGTDLGDARLLADEEVYPGEAGPTVGALVTDPAEVESVWERVGFSAPVPSLGDEALLVVATGLPDDCNLRFDDVVIGADETRIPLVYGGPVSRLLEPNCDGDWTPRAIALGVPSDTADPERDVVIAEPWMWDDVVFPFDVAPDPELWERRQLTADDLPSHLGCYDAAVLASGGHGTFALVASVEGAATEAQGAPVDLEVTLPSDDVQVRLSVGGDVSWPFCNDMVTSGRPLDLGSWTAESGQVRFRAVAVDGEVAATVEFSDVTFQPSSGEAEGPWHLDELVIEDVAVGVWPG